MAPDEPTRKPTRTEVVSVRLSYETIGQLYKIKTLRRDLTLSETIRAAIEAYLAAQKEKAA